MTKQADTTAADGLGRASFLAGLLLIVIGACAMLMLSLAQLQRITLPGCGPGSGCAAASTSVWGSIPGLGWPVSFAGLAYFLALGAAWWTVRRTGIAAPMRYLIRAAAAVSILYLAVMLFGGYACVYCLAAHVANLGLLACAELSKRSDAPVRTPAAAFGATVIAVTAALAVAQWRWTTIAVEQAEEELTASTQEIIAGSSEASRGFTGRYRLGTATAPIRIVAFSDYQCSDCQRIERDIEAVLSARDDVSYASKHFPFCSDCNASLRERGMNPHPNACRAAQAAEAAGILHGNDGYWEVHRWLFARGGRFSEAELRQFVTSRGYDAGEFLQAMESAEVAARIEADIDEALSLGLHFTPMIFINGVELRGYRAPQAVPRAVQMIAAENLEASSAQSDTPALAAAKYVDDWREQSVIVMPEDRRPWTRGPDDARVNIVVWGDYQQANLPELDATIRRILAERDDVQYHFRSYPLDESCNAAVSFTRYPQGCLAARAAEAAGSLGGGQAYWAMHDWLLSHRKDLDEESLVAAAFGLNLDAEVFVTELDEVTTSLAIAEDCVAGKRLGFRSVPTLYVNDKHVPRWRLEGVPVIERIVEIAASESAP